MSKIIFPAGMTIDFSHLNIEMMQYYSKMWSLEHYQMEKGQFEGNLCLIHTPHIQFSSAHYTNGIMSKGEFPDGCIVLIHLINDGDHLFQNKPMEYDEIILLRRGGEIDSVTSGIYYVGTIVIEEQLFYDKLYEFFGDIPQTLLSNKHFTIKHDMVSYFHTRIAMWKDYLMNDLPKLSSIPDYDNIESTILQEIFSCIVFTDFPKTRKKFEASTIRDLIHENISNDINIPYLSKELRMSERQVYHAFKKDYGISPKKYLNNLRLNAVRKELLLADPNTTTVTDIAYKYNIFHMGHFSQAYKRFFGHLPSETLIKKI